MNFALITEGPSEHRIIKHIISKYFKDRDPDVNQIQPKLVDGKQDTVGGWNEVLKYCERDELNDIFIENDYLIIQIDTDQSQTKPFSVNHNHPDNTLKTVDELLDNVIVKIKGLINDEIFKKHSSKIFFAICIHTIECWLLPIYYSNSHKGDTTNCLFSLNSELRKKDIRVIPPKDKNSVNSIRTYKTILKNWKKKQDIINAARHNLAFKFFIDSIEVL